MRSKHRNFSLIAGVLVTSGLGLMAPEAYAEGSLARLNLECIELETVPQNLRKALADVFAPTPDGLPTRICLSPVIRHGVHRFRVARADRNEIWCRPSGECQTWLLGRAGAGALAALAPVRGLSTTKGFTVRKGAYSSSQDLELIFPEGTFRWVPSVERFAFIAGSHESNLTLAN